MIRRRIEMPTPEHPAVASWGRLGTPGADAAQAVETLQKRRKGIVYRLVGAGPSGSDVIAKWSSCERIRREAVAYEQILPALSIETVRYYGTLLQPDGAGGWLFVAPAGPESYAPGLRRHRALAAHWLAALHRSAAQSPPSAPLPDRGTSYYLARLLSARDRLRRHAREGALRAADVALLKAIGDQCDVVASRWEEVERLCAVMPPTVVHGDFAPKNIGIDRSATAITLQAFDWANAGWGVAAADLPQRDRAPSDYWASPDLDVYLRETSRFWPHVRRRDLDALSHIGKVLRTLVCLDLEAGGLTIDWPEAALHDMRYYRADLGDALRGLRWHA
jgi:hypothetical protein